MTDEADRLAGHPDLAGAGSAMRAEWREEQETATRDAAEAWQHGRTLRDFALECGNAGRPLALAFPWQRFSGQVLEVGRDCVSLRGVGGRVDVNVATDAPMVWQAGERPAEAGPAPKASEESFLAVLRAREGAGEVTIGTSFDGDVYDGRVVVGADHVRVIGRGGGETLLPLRIITYVTPRRD